MGNLVTRKQPSISTHLVEGFPNYFLTLILSSPKKLAMIKTEKLKRWLQATTLGQHGAIKTHRVYGVSITVCDKKGRPKVPIKKYREYIYPVRPQDVIVITRQEKSGPHTDILQVEEDKDSSLVLQGIAAGNKYGWSMPQELLFRQYPGLKTAIK